MRIIYGAMPHLSIKTNGLLLGLIVGMFVEFSSLGAFALSSRHDTLHGILCCIGSLFLAFLVMLLLKHLISSMLEYFLEDSMENYEEQKAIKLLISSLQKCFIVGAALGTSLAMLFTNALMGTTCKQSTSLYLSVLFFIFCWAVPDPSASDAEEDEKQSLSSPLV